MIGAAEVFEQLQGRQPTAEVVGDIVVPRLVQGWLADGPRVFDGSDRAQLDALCRQIDVRRKVSVTYADGWKRADPETSAPATTIAGLVAVLLANAGPLPSEGAGDGGWGLKCVNSALKALELSDEIPAAPQLRAWALTVLDDRTGIAR